MARDRDDSVNSACWQWIDPSHSLFAIIFPKTAERAVRENWPCNVTTEHALIELQSMIRGILLSGLATDDIVEQIVSEVLACAAKERPLSRIDKRGNGQALFWTFLRRRVVKEIKRMQRQDRMVALDGLSDTVLAVKGKEIDGSTNESKELLEHVTTKWIPFLPPKQAEAMRKWMAIEFQVPGAPDRLTAVEKTNRTRAIQALQARARTEGLLM